MNRLVRPLLLGLSFALIAAMPARAQTSQTQPEPAAPAVVPADTLPDVPAPDVPPEPTAEPVLEQLAPGMGFMSLPTPVLIGNETLIGAGIGGLTPGSFFGKAVVPIGDIDGDGVVDLAVGAYRYSLPGSTDIFTGVNAGAVFILRMNANGTVKASTLISNAELGGSLLKVRQGGSQPAYNTEARFGSSVAVLPDLDGDGIPELAVGALGDDTNDLNNDGIPDGFDDDYAGFPPDPGADLYYGSESTGALYILFLNSNGTLKRWSKIDDTSPALVLDRFDAANSDAPNYYFSLGNANFGSSVAYLGQFGGRHALAVGAAGLQQYANANIQTGFGGFFTLLLNVDGSFNVTVYKASRFSNDELTATSAAGKQLLNNRFGESVTTLGDGGAGTPPTLVFGAPTHEPNNGTTITGAVNSGAVFPTTLAFNAGTETFSLTGIGRLDAATTGLPLAADDNFGYSVANAGDLDGDGAPELLVGARFDDNDAANAGAAYLLFGTGSGAAYAFRNDPNTRLVIDNGTNGFDGALAADDAFGSGASVGDFDGDGNPDLFLGAAQDESLRGSVWLARLNPPVVGVTQYLGAVAHNNSDGVVRTASQTDPGDELVYVISVENRGFLKATNVRFSETFESRTTLLSADPASSGATAGLSGQTLTVTGLGDLKPATTQNTGTSKTFTARVRIQDPFPATLGPPTVSNQGTVFADNLPAAGLLTDNGQPGPLFQPTVTAIDAAPLLKATKADALTTDPGADGLASPGDGLTYTVSVTNTGDQDAFVTLKDTPGAHLAFAPGTPDVLNGTQLVRSFGVPGQAGGSTSPGSGSTQFGVAINPLLPANVFSVSNQGTIEADRVTSFQTDDPDTPTPGDATVTPVPTADVQVTKTVSDEEPDYGEAITFTVTLTNNGPDAATNLSVADAIPAGLTGVTATPSAGTYANGVWSLPALSASAGANTATLALTGTVATADTLFNTATLTRLDQRDTNAANNAATAEAVPLLPNLEASKSWSQGAGDDLNNNGQVNPGETILYEIEIANFGGTAGNVVVTDLVDDPNLEFVAGSVVADDPNAVVAKGNTPGDTTVEVRYAALEGVESFTALRFQARVKNPLPAGVAAVSNQGSLTAANLVESDRATPRTLRTNDPNTQTPNDATRVPVDAAPDLALAKSDGGINVAPGATVAYTLSYQNKGNQGATGVVLSETVPTGSTFNAAASTAGWACTPNASEGSTCTLALGALAASASGSAQFAVDVAASLPQGTTEISNTATIADDGQNGQDPTPEDNTATDTTPVRVVDLLLTKTDGDARAVPGQTVAYTLSYRNKGNTTADGVALTETVPAGSRFDAALSTAGWACAPNGNAGSTCTLFVGTLPVEASARTATFAVTAQSPAPATLESLFNAASIAYDGAYGADPNPFDNSATDTTPVDAEAVLTATKRDALLVDIDNDGQADPGDTIRYTVTATNTGNRDAADATLIDTPGAHLAFAAGTQDVSGGTLTRSLGTIAGQSGSTPGSVTTTFDVIVDAPLPAGVASVSNQGRLEYGEDDLPPIGRPGEAAPEAGAAEGGQPRPFVLTDDPDTPEALDATLTPVDAAPDLALSKSDGDAAATPGGTVVYTISFQNKGNQGATGVVITETVPQGSRFDDVASAPGWSCAPDANAGSTCTLQLGALDASASASAEFAVTAQSPAPAGLDSLRNTATIADDGQNGQDPTPEDNTAADTTPVNAAPDLALTKTTTAQSAVPGQTVTYTLAVSNNGTQDATGVVVRERLPEGTTLAATGNSGWTLNTTTGDYEYALGSLGAGATPQQIPIVVELPAVVGAALESITNTASISDDGQNGPEPTPQDNTDSATLPVDAAPVLSFTKTDGGAAVKPGGTAVYTLLVTNTGNQDAAGLFLNEQTPAGTTFAPGQSTAGWYDDAQGRPRFDLPVVAGGGGQATVAFAVALPNTVPAGLDVISNRAFLFDDAQNPPLGQADDTTRVDAAPDLALAKSDGGINVAPGATVAYTLSYQNKGNQGATGVVLSETVPTGSTFNAAASTAGWACTPNANEGSTCTLALGALAASASGSAQFAVAVDDPVVGSLAQLANTATIADDGQNGQDPTPADNTAADTTPLVPVIDFVKTADRAAVRPGETILYTLTARNRGGAAQAVSVSDLLEAPQLVLVPGTVTTTRGTVTQGNAPAESTVSVSVGTLAPDEAVTVTFQAQLPPAVPAGLEAVSNQAVLSTPTLQSQVRSDSSAAPGAAARAARPTVVRVEATPDLALEKTSEATFAGPGDVVVYRLIYRNKGDQDATGLVLGEAVPAEAVFVPEESTPGWAPGTGGRFTLALGALEATGSDTAFFAVRLDAAAVLDTLTNEAQVFDDGTNGQEPTPQDNTALLKLPVGRVDLVLEKRAEGGSQGEAAVIRPGEPVGYALRVRNQGRRQATGVTLTDTLPEGMMLLEAESPGWQATGTPGTYSYSVGLLTPGQEATVPLVALLPAPVAADLLALTNRAAVRDDGKSGQEETLENNADSLALPVEALVDLVLTKARVDEAGQPVDEGAAVRPGERVRYALRVENRGARAAAGVVLREWLPAATSFEAEGSSPSWQATPGGGQPGEAEHYRLVLGPLSGSAAQGEAPHLVAYFAVRLADPVAADLFAITNRARAEALAPAPEGTPPGEAPLANEPDLTNNEALLALAVEASPVLAVTKRAEVADAPEGGGNGDGLLNPGERVRYRLTITNTGDREATGVVLADTLGAPAAAPGSALLSLVSGTLAASQGTAQAAALSGGGERLTAELGRLAGRGGAATLTFEARLAPRVDAFTEAVENQAWASAANATGAGTPEHPAPSDDPATPPPGDATQTPIAARPLLVASKTDVLLEPSGQQNGLFEPGERLRYHLIVRNEGTRAAAGVVLTDTVDALTALACETVRLGGQAPAAGQLTACSEGALTLALGGLATGEAAEVTFEGRLRSALPAGVEAVSNQGLVTAENALAEDGQTPLVVLTDDPDTDEAGDATRTPLVARPLLEAWKAAEVVDANENGIADPGERVRYRLTLRNAGAVEATGLVLTDTLDAATRLVAGTLQASRGTIAHSDGVVAAQLGTLGAGEEAEVRFEATIDAQLPTSKRLVTNQGHVTAENLFEADGQTPLVVPTDDPATPRAPGEGPDATVVVVPLVDVALTKRLVAGGSAGGVPPVGQEVTFELLLTNAGPDVATGLVVEEQMPEGLALTGFELLEGDAAATFGPVPGGQGGGQGGTRYGWQVPQLAPGTQALMRLRARLETAGLLTNRAEVVAQRERDLDSVPGDGRDDDYAEAATTAEAADLSLEKVAARRFETAPGPEAPLGVGTHERFVYRLQVTNQGPAAALGVVVEEQLPEGVTLAAAYRLEEGPQGWQRAGSGEAAEAGYDAAAGRWSVGALAAGEARALELEVFAAQAGRYANTAVARLSAPSDPRMENNEASVVVEVVEGFAAVLTGAGAVPAVGGTGGGVFTARLEPGAGGGAVLVVAGTVEVEGSVSGAYVGEGLFGEAGTPLFALTPAPGGAAGKQGGAAVTFTPAENRFSLTPAQRAALEAALEARALFVEVRSPAERLRGQLVPSGAEALFAAPLSGRAEAAPNASEGEGALLVEVRPGAAAGAPAGGDTRLLVVTGAFAGLEGLFDGEPGGGAHLHEARLGESGPIVAPLVVTGLAGDGRSGRLRAAENTIVLTEVLEAALTAGRLYANLHTAAYRAGELRGQLVPLWREAASTLPLPALPLAALPLARVFEASLRAENAAPAAAADRLVAGAAAEAGFGGVIATLEALPASPGQYRLVVAGAFSGLERPFAAAPSLRAGRAGLPEGASGDAPALALTAQAEAGGLSGRFRAEENTFVVGGDLARRLLEEGLFVEVPLAAPAGGSCGAAGSLPGIAAGIACAEALRGQLVASTNRRPEAGRLTEPAPGTTIRLPGTVGSGAGSGTGQVEVVRLAWTAGGDANLNPIAYRVQASLTDGFEAVLAERVLASEGGALPPSVLEVPLGELASLVEATGLPPGARLDLYVRLVVTDGSKASASQAVALVLERGAVGTGAEEGALPQAFALVGAYPNPFNPQTSIAVDLPEAARVEVALYDLLGRRVLGLEQALSAGRAQRVHVEAGHLASGSYLYRVTARTASGRLHTAHGSLTLLK